MTGRSRPWPVGRTPPILILLHGTLLMLRRRLVVVTVRGTSMEPTLHEGDRMLVHRSRRVVPGQVIVVAQPMVYHGLSEAFSPLGKAVSDRPWIIKRVVAVAGDPIPRDQVPALADTPEQRVPPGKLVLLGDNPEASVDSRQHGYFPVSQVLGVVFYRRTRRGPVLYTSSL